MIMKILGQYVFLMRIEYIMMKINKGTNEMINSVVNFGKKSKERDKRRCMKK